MSFINITVIKRIKQDEFKTFADFIYNNMDGKTVYAAFQDAVTNMGVAAENFQTALIKSKNRAKDAIEAKNIAYDNLYNALIRIAKTMDAILPQNEHDQLKTQAGFTLYKTPERKNVTFVEPPTNLLAINDPRRGVIIVKWKKAANAITTTFEMQENGSDWKDNVYCEKEQMELTYPFGTKLLIRAKTIGTNLLSSNYTLPVEVMVS